MSAYHSMSSSSLNPITIFNSFPPPISSSSLNPPAISFSSVSSRIRSHLLPSADPNTCDHQSKDFLAIQGEDFVHLCYLYHTIVKENRQEWLNDQRKKGYFVIK